MRPLRVTPREAQVLDALCELGETDLITYKLGISRRTLETHLARIMANNSYPNRLTLALAWDRTKRRQGEPA